MAAAEAPLRVVVTGAAGLIGWHLRAFWHGLDDIEAVALDRQAFQNDQRLADALARAEAVVHLAGLNRGPDGEIESTNLELTLRLLALLPTEGPRPYILFASSTHRDRDTAYGRSKRQNAEVLAQWARESGGRFTELVLPNVFGEHGRPFHNSAISTFCHLLAEGKPPELHQDQDIEWLHAQRVAERIDELIRRPGEPGPTVERAAGTVVKVSRVLELLGAWDEDYRSGIVPAIDQPFDRDLFNTYRSYLYPAHFPIQPVLHEDPRGRLFEAVKVRSGGQSFLSSTVPGAQRGGHYHRRKFERFLVVEGRARIRVRRLLTEKIDVFEIEGDRPAYVDMPTLHTHDLENIGTTPLVTLFWADEIFDPEAPDTIYCPVEVPGES